MIWLGAATGTLAGEAADYMSGVEGCFDVARKSGDLGCLGEASNLCQASTEGGSSTLGISECEAAEAEAWGALLDHEYKVALEQAREIDRTDPSPVGSAVETVTAAEDAWVAFRDAQCKMDYARWGGGSMRNVAAGICLRTMTAMRAIELYHWRQIEPEE